MKNLKQFMLLFSFCALIATQTTFAQEDSRAAIEKAELDRANNIENLDLSNLKEKELAALHKKYEEATPKQRVAIQKEIEALERSYNKEIKGYETEEERLANIEKKKILKEQAMNKPQELEKKYDLSEEEAFIIEARKRIKSAKVKFAKEQENGELTQEEISQKRYKIGLIEKKLNHHVTSVDNAKVKIAERIQEIRELQE